MKLPHLQAAFTNLRHLLDCDVFMSIIHCTLNRYLNNKTNQNYESHLIKILYLIGLALHEEHNEMIDYDNNIVIDKYSSIFEFKFIDKSLNFHLRPNLIKYYLNEIIELPQLKDTYTRHLIEWTLNYYNELVQIKFKLTNTTSEIKELDIPKDLINEKLNSDKEQAKLRAEKRRAKLLNKFNQMQTEFVNKNQELESSIRKSLSHNDELSSGANTSLDINDTLYILGPQENLTSLIVNSSKKIFHCILCQEDAELTQNTNDSDTSSNETSPMILPCYVQNSNVLSKKRGQTQNSNLLFKKHKELNGPFTSTCGHSMHANCWHKYISNLNRRAYLIREDTNENWCPLCESICNCVLNVFPSHKNPVSSDEKCFEKITYEEWFEQLKNSHRNNLGKLF